MGRRGPDRQRIILLPSGRDASHIAIRSATNAVHCNMPYFVYRVAAPSQLIHVDTKERYQDARMLVRTLRAAQGPGTGDQYRMVFANHQAEAERLLSTPRDERVIGED